MAGDGKVNRCAFQAGLLSFATVSVSVPVKDTDTGQSGSLYAIARSSHQQRVTGS